MHLLVQSQSLAQWPVETLNPLTDSGRLYTGYRFPGKTYISPQKLLDCCPSFWSQPTYLPMPTVLAQPPLCKQDSVLTVGRKIVDCIACTLTCIALLHLTSWDRLLCLNADTKYTIITAVALASEMFREYLRLTGEQSFPRTEPSTKQEVRNMGNTMQLRMSLADLVVQPVLAVLYFYGPVEYHKLCVCGFAGLYVVHLRNCMLLAKYTNTVSETYAPSCAADPPPQPPIPSGVESVSQAAPDEIQCVRLNISSSTYEHDVTSMHTLHTELIHQYDMNRMCMHVQVALILCSLGAMWITPDFFKLLT